LTPHGIWIPGGDRALTWLYSYLSEVRPFSIFLIYLALIPIFAVVFCVLPGQQFYAPYARLEPTALADAVAADTSDGGPATLNQHLLFRPPEVAIVADSVCWGGEEEIALLNLVAGWSGDPRGLSGFPGRMTYFSATTITTVGFGVDHPLT